MNLIAKFLDIMIFGKGVKSLGYVMGLLLVLFLAVAIPFCIWANYSPPEKPQSQIILENVDAAEELLNKYIDSVNVEISATNNKIDSLWDRLKLTE